jgi:hypothetical protein
MGGWTVKACQPFLLSSFWFFHFYNEFYAMTVLIAGGGIAGLTLALSLHQIDVPVRVFETVSKMKPLGVGLNLLPHAVRELDELGFLPQLEQMAIATSELAYFTKRGQKIWSEVRGRDAGYNWPQFSIGRGALHMMLWDECCKRIGADNVFTRHHLSDWQDHDGKVTANFINHATGKKCGTYDGDISFDEIAFRQKVVPNVVGMKAKDAVFLLENSGLSTTISGKGKVKHQSIKAGKPVTDNQLIKLQLSTY